jgi:hypothetical protein
VGKLVFKFHKLSGVSYARCTKDVKNLCYFTFSKASKEDRARKEPEVLDITAATPTSGNRLRETSSLSGYTKDQSSGQRTRRQSQLFARQATPPKSVTVIPQEVKRERWSQRREKKRLEEAK